MSIRGAPDRRMGVNNPPDPRRTTMKYMLLLTRGAWQDTADEALPPKALAERLRVLAQRG